MEAITTMTQQRQCTACGRALAAGEPDGLCSRCFLDAGMAAAAAPAAPPDAAAELEKILPRYEILADEGGGSYRARDREGGAIVALSIPREPVAEFATRAASLAALDHPGLARVVDHGEAGGVRYLATEYVEGRALSEVRLQPREALRVIEQISAALGHAHDHGVHLAVRAESVRVVADGSARIARPELTREPLDAGAVDALLRAALGDAPPKRVTEPEPRTAEPAKRARPRPTGAPGKGMLVFLSAGVAAFVASFLPWIQATWPEGYSISANGWETALGNSGTPLWPALVVGVAATLLAAAKRIGWFDVPWPALLAGAGFGNLATLLWLVLALGVETPAGVEFSLGFGSVLTWLCFIAMTMAAVALRPAPAPVTRRPVARAPRRRRAKRRRS